MMGLRNFRFAGQRTKSSQVNKCSDLLSIAIQKIGILNNDLEL